MENYEHGTVPIKIFGELASETYTFAKEYNEHGNFGQTIFVSSWKIVNLTKVQF